MSAGSGIWVVIAAYNEEPRIGATLAKLRHRYEQIVVVDDCSEDATAEVAHRGGAWVLSHLINLGQGAALQTGVDFCLERGADTIVTFDADGQHDPEDIEKLLAPIELGQSDVVLGSRFLGTTHNMPWTRYLVLQMGVLFTRLISSIHVTDTHNGLRALSRRAAFQMRLTQNRMAHASEFLDLVAELGLSYQEVPVTINYEAETLQKGQSSLNALNIMMKMLLRKVTP